MQETLDRRSKTPQYNYSPKLAGRIKVKPDSTPVNTFEPFFKNPKAILPVPTGLMIDPREQHKNISLQAIGFYSYLKGLWDYLGCPDKFYRTDEQICCDLKISGKTVRKLKQELRQEQIIDYWRAALTKGNKQTVTYYKFLKGF